MKAILICPEHRPSGGAFHRMKPLPLMPILGRSLLDHTLTSLKRDGIQEVLVLAADRPEMIRAAVGRGQAWGMKVDVLATPTELATDMAELQHASLTAGQPRPRVVVLDEMPTMPGRTLWATTYATFEALRLAMKDEKLAAHLTMHEVSPGVWISTKARISAEAEITGPVWIGPYATVLSGAMIGPNTIVETGAYIDSHAMIDESWIGPGTYVGVSAAIRKSCAWGDGLLNWSDGSFLEVRDRYLLNDLTARKAQAFGVSPVERFMALMLMLITLPRALMIMLRSRCVDHAVFSEKRVVLPPPNRVDAFSRTHELLRFSDEVGLFQRWPELWCVVRGELALVGNRPLALEEITALRGPFGKLWLDSPAGVFSLADAEGANADSISDSLAHAAFFTARRTRALRLRVLGQCLCRFLLPTPAATSAIESSHEITL